MTLVWQRAMVTGHRPNRLSGSDALWVREELDRIAVKLATEHDTTAGISGMALGADTMWAKSVLAADLALWSYVPFEQQADKWSAEQQREWRSLRSLAAHEVVVGDGYSVGLLHARNDAMLRDADVVVAVWDPATTTGGTASAVMKARKRGLSIIHVDFPARRTTLSEPSAAD